MMCDRSTALDWCMCLVMIVLRECDWNGQSAYNWGERIVSGRTWCSQWYIEQFTPRRIVRKLSFISHHMHHSVQRFLLSSFVQLYFLCAMIHSSTISPATCRSSALYTSQSNPSTSGSVHHMSRVPPSGTLLVHHRSDSA